MCPTPGAGSEIPGTAPRPDFGLTARSLRTCLGGLDPRENGARAAQQRRGARGARREVRTGWPALHEVRWAHRLPARRCADPLAGRDAAADRSRAEVPLLQACVAFRLGSHDLRSLREDARANRDRCHVPFLGSGSPRLERPSTIGDDELLLAIQRRLRDADHRALETAEREKRHAERARRLAKYEEELEA